MIKFFETHRKFSLFITLIGAVLIFYISSLDFGGVGGIKGYYSIIYHFFAFFCFSFFVFITIVNGRKKFNLFFVGFLLSFGYAITDELHQSFVPWRYCDIFDVVVDSTGIIFAMMIYLIIISLRE